MESTDETTSEREYGYLGIGDPIGEPPGAELQRRIETVFQRYVREANTPEMRDRLQAELRVELQRLINAGDSFCQNLQLEVQQDPRVPEQIRINLTRRSGPQVILTGRRPGL